MKIPFDIKYRPQIESGEYKIIYLSYATEEEYPARIICWDRHNEYPIVALVSNSGGYERAQMFQEEGIDNNNPHLGTLLIVTPEEELTEFEKTVKDRLWRTLEYSETFRKDENKWVRGLAAELLTLAEREIVNRVSKECYKEDFCIEDTVKFDEGYKLGKEVALKDLPRWKKCADCTPKPKYSNEWIFSIDSENVTRESAIVHNGYFLPLDGLEKLPKEK